MKRQEGEIEENIMENYDIVVVGAGAGGVFLTYELCRKNCPAKVLVLEKGTPLEKRICPIKEGKTEKCCLLYTSRCV